MRGSQWVAGLCGGLERRLRPCISDEGGCAPQFPFSTHNQFPWRVILPIWADRGDSNFNNHNLGVPGDLISNWACECWTQLWVLSGRRPKGNYIYICSICLIMHINTICVPHDKWAWPTGACFLWQTFLWCGPSLDQHIQVSSSTTLTPRKPVKA